MTKNAALATFLLELSDRSEAEGLDSRTLRLHVRRPDLAEHLGLTLDALERTLHDMSSSGVVDVAAEDTVTIQDRDALQRVSGERETVGKGGVPRKRTESALRAILADERFLSTPRTSALLVYLVEQAIADGAANLDLERIAVEVLGRPSGFDPADPALRVLVTHLRKMLDDYDARTTDAPVTIRLERGACRVVIEPRECY